MWATHVLQNPQWWCTHVIITHHYENHQSLALGAPSLSAVGVMG
jgi:hypothetical protein